MAIYLSKYSDHHSPVPVRRISRNWWRAFSDGLVLFYGVTPQTLCRTKELTRRFKQGRISSMWIVPAAFAKSGGTRLHDLRQAARALDVAVVLGEPLEADLEEILEDVHCGTIRPDYPCDVNNVTAALDGDDRNWDRPVIDLRPGCEFEAQRASVSTALCLFEAMAVKHCVIRATASEGVPWASFFEWLVERRFSKGQKVGPEVIVERPLGDAWSEPLIATAHQAGVTESRYVLDENLELVEEGRLRQLEQEVEAWRARQVLVTGLSACSTDYETDEIRQTHHRLFKGLSLDAILDRRGIMTGNWQSVRSDFKLAYMRAKRYGRPNQRQLQQFFTRKLSADHSNALPEMVGNWCTFRPRANARNLGQWMVAFRHTGSSMLQYMAHSVGLWFLSRLIYWSRAPIAQDRSVLSNGAGSCSIEKPNAAPAPRDLKSEEIATYSVSNAACERRQVNSHS
ncbi:hypothetical protein [Pseudovibrio exalbescens]|uniref:hypothetical protein n=1 Tax=Pseudovibrio exalbescens TaxID=197461 RepID=UPI0011AFAA2A|nr:hypothetical protein [Pseudovibrio exalbescens]